MDNAAGGVNYQSSLAQQRTFEFELDDVFGSGSCSELSSPLSPLSPTSPCQLSSDSSPNSSHHQPTPLSSTVPVSTSCLLVSEPAASTPPEQRPVPTAELQRLKITSCSEGESQSSPMVRVTTITGNNSKAKEVSMVMFVVGVGRDYFLWWERRAPMGV